MKPTERPLSDRDCADVPERDGPRDECGVFGLYAPGREVARLAYFALYALQHRGQESAGIATCEGGHITTLRDTGLVSQVFDEEKLRALDGDMAIGHVRYSTTGGGSWENTQPVWRDDGREVALAHNGNLTNAVELYNELRERGINFRGTSDSEIIAALVSVEEARPIENAVAAVMPRLEGAYSTVVMTKRAVVAFRDPHGVRPLSLGKLGDRFCVASESCAFDIIGAELMREVQPGELVALTEEGLETRQIVPADRPAHCVFEHIYFSRPDSRLEGRVLQEVRGRMGEILAREAPADADLVISVPDSGNAAANGYARASGLPKDDGLIKNRYVQRTFIQPGQELRKHGLRMKFNPLPEIVSGKRVVVVDDSIVRGNTTRQIIGMLRDAGAQEVHLRISAPPIRYPCHYGVDMSTSEEMIAHGRSVEEIAAEIGADSLAYLSLDGVYEAVGTPREVHCDACFTGDYPLADGGEANGKFALEALPVVPRVNEAELTAVLRDHFGHPGFRPGQLDAVEAAVDGRDVLLVMPTGAGKSLCYQLPAVCDRRLAVVVSPLVSLMTDQVESLGGRAELINAQRDAAANRRALERAAAGEVSLLYVAPERFASPGFTDRLAETAIGLFVVDEAHCVSQWGHDFRPDYFRLGDVARELGARSIFAATATATPRVAADVVRRLGLRDPVRITTGFDRPNLSYDVVKIGSEQAKRAATVALLREPGALPAIVYAGTRKKTEATADWLERELGHPVPAYHAGMEREPRAEAQRAFMAGEAPVVVATNAFGMGVDKADVRTVVHEVVPSSLEAYYQEAGRGGRDGLPSRCVLLAENRDKGLHVFFINQIDDPEAKNHRWRQYREVWGFVEGDECRRRAILAHFGDRAEAVATGRCCDVCDGPLAVAAEKPKPRSVAELADVEDAILAVVGSAAPPVGRTKTVEILRGGRSKALLKYAYDALPGYGEFAEWRADDLLAEVDTLVDAGRLRSTGGRYPTLRVAEAA